MSETVYAIDPDVFIASMDNRPCAHLLWEILFNPDREEKAILALDQDKVEEEYIALLTSSKIGKELKDLLDDIFNKRDRSPLVQTVSAHLVEELDELRKKQGCDTPVEPSLIGMAASPDGPNLTILIIGNSNLRQRRIAEKSVQKTLRNFMRRKLNKNFDIKTSLDVGLRHDARTVAELHSRVFEEQIFTILQQRIYDIYRKMPQFHRVTPDEAYNYKISDRKKAGEIDKYLYIETEEEKFVWICECELREEWNELSPTKEKKMQKLINKLRGVTLFEQGQCTKRLVIQGYFATNALEMMSGASTLADEHSVKRIRATMPTGWTENTHWFLRDSDVEKFDV